MSRESFPNQYNWELIQQMEQRYNQDYHSVDPSWQGFFAGFHLAQESPRPFAFSPQIGIVNLIDAYRSFGHLQAHLDPLTDAPPPYPDLSLEHFGFSEADLDKSYDTSYLTGMPKTATLRQLVQALRDTYCRSIGVEYMHIMDVKIRRWLQDRMEPSRNQGAFTREDRLHILRKLHESEIFEDFLHRTFQGQKRFSLEGAETLIPLLDQIVDCAADSGAAEMVFGMAHRGRLNVLATILNKPHSTIFTEFEENYLPNSSGGDGDVKYHLGYAHDHRSRKGNTIHLTLVPNPSHLEAVNPVVEGRARVSQHFNGDENRTRVVPLLIHGDAAIAGQGVVTETLNLSQLQGYKTGGTLHVVINNQIGFTTRPADARSTRYCTDVAKMIEVPIFHVNAEDPESVLFVAALAVEFRQAFKKDVFIDMYCYRKYGHNEGDEPAYTNPEMCSRIKTKQPLSAIYAEKLIRSEMLTAAENKQISDRMSQQLKDERESQKKLPARPFDQNPYKERWASVAKDYSFAPTPTGVPLETLQKIGRVLGTVPDNFNVQEKLRKNELQGRLDAIEKNGSVNWGFAESLAFGSLLLEKIPVRLSGQDSRRGTFSQRHAYLYDAKNETPYVPLHNLDPNQARFTVYDSLLSEAAVLGFEFGYSLFSPHQLVMWEAQFGDFVNGAQVVIDQYIASARSKWQRDTGLVLLLPHGYEGQGPEHSSARLERFLQLCADDNLQVCYPSTAGQYFHLLRRQVKAKYRRPLIVMTPKSLLRRASANSPLTDLTEGSFQNVLDDSGIARVRVQRLLLCSGKVAHDLVDQRAKETGAQAAIVRLEQFHPFPEEQLLAVLATYPESAKKQVFWVQEESKNMGGWSFVEPRLRKLGLDVKYVGRNASASPASGSKKVYEKEQDKLLTSAFHSDVDVEV